MIYTEEKTIEELKSYGRVMAIALLAITAYMLWRDRSFALLTLISALFFLALSVIAPGRLRGIEKKWTYLGERLSIVMSFVILTLTFYVVIFPMGVIMRVFGKSSLKLAFNRTSPTYWEVSDHEGSGSRYDKPY